MIGIALIFGGFALCWLFYDKGLHDGRRRDEAWQMDLAIEQTIRRTIRAELGVAEDPPPFRRVLPVFDQDTTR